MSNPHEFHADDSNASRDGLLAILRAETATVADALDDDARVSFEIHIYEHDDE